MEIITGTLDFQLYRETAVAVGKFDGLHRGHRLLLEEILNRKAQGFASCVFTFDPSPAVLFGSGDGKELTTREEKRAILAGMGVDILVEFPLDFTTAAMPPEDFVAEVLVNRMNTAWIAAGRDVSFGAKGAGDAAQLKHLGGQYGFGVTIIDKISFHNREISSTYVRELVEAGKMREAEKLLGAPYPVRGKVAHGRRLGRTLGMPTVNILPPAEKLLPPNGVYYSAVQVAGQRYASISNVGYKPTVTEDRRLGVETYIYDFDQDIYGEEICVELLEFRRPEKHFDSVEALKHQMSKDIAEGRIYAKVQKTGKFPVK